MLFGIRRRTNRALGYSPAEVLFGVTLRRPGEWAVDENVPLPNPTAIREEAKNHQRKYLLQNETASPKSRHRFHAGQQVLIKNHNLSNKCKRLYAGFGKKWIGPVTVMEEIGSDVYSVIEANGALTTVHSDHMTPFFKSD